MTPLADDWEPRLEDIAREQEMTNILFRSMNDYRTAVVRRSEVVGAWGDLLEHLDKTQPVLAGALRFGLRRSGQIAIGPEAVVPLVHVNYPPGYTT
jgi:hypothetical protein